MARQSRRDFLRHGALGVSAGLGAWTLRADAQPTEPSGSPAEARAIARQDVAPVIQPTGKWSLTEDNILGPYHRPGAPFRAKITAPMEPGDVLVIRGRVWGFDVRKPLAAAVIGVWQANASGRYDNDDPRNPPAKDLFMNRARLITDENGYYEFETIRPGRYKIGPDLWRPAHVHYFVRATGYKDLVTQLYFKGDPFNGKDQFIKASLIIDPTKVKGNGAIYEIGVFDIVLAPAT